MRAFWAGSDAAPDTGATRFFNPCAVPQGIWHTSEGNALFPLSDAVTVTRFTVWVETAPGVGKSWSFKMRVAAADTSVALTISDAATTATWSGSFPVAELARMALSVTPTGTPTAAGQVHWIMEYETAGNFYLLPGNTGDTQAVDSPLRLPIVGGHNTTPSPSNRDSLAPSAFTVTKLAVYPPDAAVGNNNHYRFRKNDTPPESALVTASGTSSAIVTYAPAIEFVSGDTLQITHDDNGGSWSNHSYCTTIIPSVPGEIILPMAYSSAAVVIGGLNAYAMPQGLGASGWNASESVVGLRLPACTLKKLYAQVDTAPGVGKSFAFTVRSNGVSTSVVATVADANTRATDFVNEAAHLDGNVIAIEADPTGSPASTPAIVSLVAVVPQTTGSGQFFSLF